MDEFLEQITFSGKNSGTVSTPSGHFSIFANAAVEIKAKKMHLANILTQMTEWSPDKDKLNIT